MPIDNALVSKVHANLVQRGIRPERATPQQVRESAQTVQPGARVPLQTVADLHQAVVAYATRLIDAGAQKQVSFGQQNAGGVGGTLGVRTAQMQAKAFDATDLLGFDPLKGLPRRDAYSPKEYLQVAQAHKGYLDEALSQIGRMKAKQTVQRSELVAQRDTARGVVLATLLPEASDAALKQLRSVLVVPALVGVSVQSRIQSLTEDLAARKGELQAVLGGRAPDAIAVERERLSSQLRDAKGLIDKLMSNNDVRDLVKTGYGTGNYKGGIFSPTSWNDASQEKAALKAFPQFKSWTALLEALSSADAQKTSAEAALNKLPKADDVERARAGLSALRAQEANVPKAVLDELWAQLGAHLDAADPADLTQRLEGKPVAGDLARYLGLKNQVVAFDAVGDQQLTKLEGSIKKELAGLSQEMAKLRQSPPKGTVSREAIEKRFTQRADTLGRSVQSVETRATTIHQYNTYSPGMTFWDYMLWSSILGHSHTATHHHHHYGNTSGSGFVGGGGGSFGGGGAGGSWGADATAQGGAHAAAAAAVGVGDGLAQTLPLYDGAPMPDVGSGVAHGDGAQQLHGDTSLQSPGASSLDVPSFDAPSLDAPSLDAPSGLTWDTPSGPVEVSGDSTQNIDAASFSDETRAVDDSGSSSGSSNDSADASIDGGPDASSDNGGAETRVDGS